MRRQINSKVQIGVIGSLADIELGSQLIELAQEVGKEIAKSNSRLLFGFEGDFESVSFIAAKAAEEVNGETMAFIWGKDKQDLQGLHSSKIITGQHRGGGREFSLILSCDAVISLSGGSGTLMEIAMACQTGIPVITITGTKGWSDKLANRFLDERRKIKIIGVKTPKEAVKVALGRVRRKGENT